MNERTRKNLTGAFAFLTLMGIVSLTFRQVSIIPIFIQSSARPSIQISIENRSCTIWVYQ